MDLHPLRKTGLQLLVAIALGCTSIEAIASNEVILYCLEAASAHNASSTSKQYAEFNLLLEGKNAIGPKGGERESIEVHFYEPTFEPLNS